MEPRQGEWGLWYAGTVGFATKEAAEKFILDGNSALPGAASISGPTICGLSPDDFAKLSEHDAKMATMREHRIRGAESDYMRFGSPFKLMHMSALSPTTRKTHADRHGNLYSPAEVREWWARESNAVDCKCSVVVVLVDELGKPLVERIVSRAKANYAVMKLRGKGPWTKP